MNPQDFYITTRASQGLKVDLIDPEGNREWARVRSVASEEFKRASERAFAQFIIGGVEAGSSPKRRKDFVRHRRAELVATLISDWSLPFKTESEKVSLLISNPRLRRGIERVAEDLSLHFGASND